MLAILTTHPIQYQAPLWQALASDGRVPFEVWYLSEHGLRPSRDPEFGQTFAWDIDTTSGYPHRFLCGANFSSVAGFWKCRLRERLRDSLKASGAKALWIQGWQVSAYWQAVREARAAGVELWLRGESNDLAPQPQWKAPLKRFQLSWLFGRVDRFFYIGKANKRLYQNFGVAESRLYSAPYAVDNERFVGQASALRPRRAELRRAWGIAEDAFCVLFCGKFIPKKRPMDLVNAAQELLVKGLLPNLHLLFVGSGVLGQQLHLSCNVQYDSDASVHANLVVSLQSRLGESSLPKASFAGFLNQTEISQAYVAADCLVLPSDFGETWGLVVNEALASGLNCLVSDACGCSEDLAGDRGSFQMSNIPMLASKLVELSCQGGRHFAPPAISESVSSIVSAYDATLGS